MKLTIIGTGYVGLVTGACFAEVGHHVVCVDNDAAKIKLLASGGIPIYEPGLEELVTRRTPPPGGCLSAPASPKAFKNPKSFLSPCRRHRNRMAPWIRRFIERVARDIAAALTGYRIIVDKSTVPVKTGEKVAETIKRYCPAKVDFDVVSNPEFLREGFAVDDLMKPDRIVIGTRSPRPVEAMKKIYAPFNAPIVVTDINSAELIKHASNSFLALKISYINAIAAICEITGANVQEVAAGMGMDERIGRRFLNAGIGFGGSCFPKDLSAFIKIAEEIGYDFRLLKEVQLINSRADGPLREENHRHTLGAQRQENRRARPGFQTKHRRRPHVAGD